MTKRKKLKVHCGKVDCRNGLHCYTLTAREAARATRKAGQLDLTRTDDPAGRPRSEVNPSPAASSKLQAGPIPYCKACGARLVDWERVYRREIRDVEHTFTAMKTEWIRHHFWHRRIDPLALAYAYRNGRAQLRERLKATIRRAIGDAAERLWRDGYQTPFGNKPAARNILFFAQHATASCCRKCVAEWHNIPRDRPLTEDELDYLTALAMRYIDERLPELPEDPGGTSPVHHTGSDDLGGVDRGNAAAPARGRMDTRAPITPAGSARPNRTRMGHARTTTLDFVSGRLEST